MSLDEALLSDALAHYGPDRQLSKTIQECGELIVAISHYQEGRATLEEVATELADVKIMVAQASKIIGENRVAGHVTGKQARLRLRMREGV